jgi:flagellar motility protein MotE (MotC chaperone)
MKQVWVLGISGVFLGILFASFLGMSNARGEKKDERANTIADPAVSGKLVEVPLTKELEDSLKAKEKDLAEKERVLREKEEALSVEEQRVKQRIAELEELQNEVMKYQEKNSDKADQQMKRLVKTFEGMNPKKSSAMLMTMKDDLAVELLMNMKEKKAATVLELLQPDRANFLSSQMAQRRPAGRAVGDTKQASPKGSPLP